MAGNGASTRRSRELPAAEYRARAYRRGPGWTRWLYGALALAVGITLAVVGYRNFGRSPISPQVTAYHVRGNAITVTVEVRRSQPDRALECVLRARDRPGRVVAHTALRLPAGGATVTARRTLHASARPVVGEVESCRYAG